MRVALLSTPFVSVPPAAYGGTELVIAELADGLIARGHDVIVYAPGDSTVRAQIRSCYPRATWPPNAYRELRHVLYAIRDLLRRDDVDLVHAHAAPALAFAAMLDLPMVYTIHHTLDPALCELYGETRSRSIRMVAISERQRELLSDTCECDVVHHGLDAGDYPFGPGEGGYAAFVGRFNQVKGAHTAVTAAATAGVRLRLGGSAHDCDLDYFRARLEPLLRMPHVAWQGEVDHPAKIALLGGAVATLFPIDWEEPFGLVMIESMLCGTPVLAFGRGSVPEVVDQGITGWVVRDEREMAARLRELARRPESFDRRRCRARAALRFGAGRMVDDYLRIYQELTGERRHAPLLTDEDASRLPLA